MPRVAQGGGSLKALCLANIAANMDKLWCKHFMQRYYGQGHFLYILGPFDELPPALTGLLWGHLKARRMLRKHHLYLLISPYASSLDFSSSDADLTTMLLLAGQRCFNLRHLDLSSCKLPKMQFSETLPLLTGLVSLNLSRSSVTDTLLSIVGLYCPLLTSLDLSYCTQLTDAGLLTLFLEQDAEGNAVAGRFGVCTRLSKLLVAGSQGVTAAGAAAVLLHLPELQVFDFQGTAAVVTRLAATHGLAGLRLRVLHTSPEEEQDLPAVLALCPDLQHLHLVTFPGLAEDTSLLALLDTRELRELRVCNEPGALSLPVASHLAPVLQAHGATLASLALAEVREVPVARLAALCPALLHLSLQWNEAYVWDGAPATAFPCLLTAEVTCREEGEPTDQVPPEHLAAVLLSPHLHTLRLSHTSTLTDHLTSEVLASGALSSLKSLQLGRCDEVTLEGLAQLLHSHNPLEEARFAMCEQVTLSDFQDYQRKVKRRGWSLQLAWS